MSTADKHPLKFDNMTEGSLRTHLDGLLYGSQVDILIKKNVMVLQNANKNA